MKINLRSHPVAAAALLGMLLSSILPRAAAGSSPAVAPAAQAAVALALDDGRYEGLLGLYNYDGTGKQFLWLNRFTPDPAAFPFTLDTVSVLFDSLGGGNPVRAGDPIEVAVYADEDGDPTNGARLLATYAETVQAVDGQSWSEYRLDPPVELTGPGDVLIAVINRFTLDSLSPKSYPATYDSTVSQGRSWYGWWPGAVDEPPELSSRAALRPQTGNWMIRGAGRVAGLLSTETPVTPNPIAPPVLPMPTPTPPESPRPPRDWIFLPLAINR